jgi:hypothetical protein
LCPQVCLGGGPALAERAGDCRNDASNFERKPSCLERGLLPLRSDEGGLDEPMHESKVEGTGYLEKMTDEKRRMKLLSSNDIETSSLIMALE